MDRVVLEGPALERRLRQLIGDAGARREMI
jgi:hypothetical protein